jgi:hypothetical protein
MKTRIYAAVLGLVIALVAGACGKSGANGGAAGDAADAGDAGDAGDGGDGGTQGPTLSSIAVAPATVAAGYVRQLTATGAYSDGSTQDISGSVSWSSSNDAAATVNSTGLATGTSPGSATVTATLGDASGSATLTIRDPPVTNGDVRAIATAPDGTIRVGSSFTQ